MNEQGMRYRLGVFMLLAIIALGILVTIFGTYPSLPGQHEDYTLVFRRATGVSPGTPIRRSGVRIGEVRKVELDDLSGKVRVQIRVEKPHPVYESDRPVLVHGFLSGDTSIDFLPPLPEGHPAEPGIVPPRSIIEGLNQTDVAQLLNQTSQMVPQAQDALTEINKTLKRYEQMAPLVEETLRAYRDLGNSANSAMPELRQLVKSFQDLEPQARATLKTLQDLGPDAKATLKVIQDLGPEAKQVLKLAQEMGPELKRTNQDVQVAVQTYTRVGERVEVWLRANQDKVADSVERLRDALERMTILLRDDNQKAVANTLKQLENGTKNLPQIAENTAALLEDSRKVAQKLEKELGQIETALDNLNKVTKPAAERSEAIVKNVEQATGELAKLTAELRETLHMLTAGDGTIRRLLNDPSIFNNLNEGVCMLVRLIPKLERILRDVEVFTDKIARHPESLGVGGAIRPSGGLKEGPSSWSTPRPPN